MRQRISADNFPAGEWRPRRGMLLGLDSGGHDRRSRAACVNALTADSLSPQRHVTSEQARIECVLPVAEPVE